MSPGSSTDSYSVFAQPDNLVRPGFEPEPLGFAARRANRYSTANYVAAPVHLNMSVFSLAADDVVHFHCCHSQKQYLYYENIRSTSQDVTGANLKYDTAYRTIISSTECHYCIPTRRKSQGNKTQRGNAVNETAYSESHRSGSINNVTLQRNKEQNCWKDRCLHDVIRLLIRALYKNQSDSLMAADGDCHHLCKLMAPVRHRWSINDVIGGIRNTVMPSDCSPVTGVVQWTEALSSDPELRSDVDFITASVANWTKIPPKLTEFQRSEQKKSGFNGFRYYCPKTGLDPTSDTIKASLMRQLGQEEYVDIVYVYGLCDGNATAAVLAYQARFPNRRISSAQVFSRAYWQISQSGQLPSPCVKKENAQRQE
ncbi:hypothetical protein ANN_23420 [Periplaneta americana]|uniref:DUF4817 domain-containing protein n=1 Tax=Periplaneta americana TaxID=6978 RepID=A0ABQ8SL18_PERAM|nr:hypothetical protein ANN_23420 [Periplaneta americana]